MIWTKKRRAQGRKSLASGLLVAALVAYWLVPAAGQAQVLEPLYTVNATNDDADSNPGDLSCDADTFSDGQQCTLRAAIQEANALPGRANITLPAGEYTLTIPDANPHGITVGDLDITDDLTINGAGARTTIVRGGAAPFNDRIFYNALATTTISGLTITGGKPPAFTYGGGILSSGASAALTLDAVAVTANTATNAGGISSFGGSLTVVDSTVSGNQAERVGGIYPAGAAATITNTTISGNHAAQFSGGVQPDSGATVNIRSSTIANNTSSQAGSGILASETGTVVNVRNTIVSNNSTTNCDTILDSAITSQGKNIDSANTCGFAQPTDERNTNPSLGPLSNNGGPTNTRALLAGSPAIDAGNSDQAADQRGISRPQNGDNNASVIDDIGAFERGDLAPPRVINVIPAENATRVSPTANVVAVFNEPMLGSSINSSTFTLRMSGQTQNLGATRAYEPATRRATLNPVNPLRLGTTYMATLTPGSRDEAGNQLDQDRNAAGNQPRSWRFTVKR